MSSLRDAAVDPKSTDFLPPVAGISPGIHANQGIHPVTPGAVSDTAATQEAAETLHMLLFQPGIDSLAVTPATATIAVDETEQLTATATLADGETTHVVTNEATWTSSDEDVATVDTTGLVTGVGAGSATITGAWRGKSDTTAVTVTSD